MYFVLFNIHNSAKNNNDNIKLLKRDIIRKNTEYINLVFNKKTMQIEQKRCEHTGNIVIS